MKLLHPFRIAVLLLLLILTLYTGGCGTKPLEAKNDEELVPVSVQNIVKGPFIQTTELIGHSRSKHNLAILAPSPMKVKQVHAQLGDKVKKGAPLIQFEDEEAKEQLKIANRNLTLLKHNIVKVEQSQQQAFQARQEMVNKSQKALERAQTVINGAQTGAFTMLDLVQVSTQLLLLQSQIQGMSVIGPSIEQLNPAQLQLQLEQARAQVRLAKENVDQHIINAPFSGSVTLRNIEPNEMAMPNIPILQISSLEQIIIDLQVGSSQIDQLKTGQKAFVLFEGDQRPIEASLDALSPGAGFQSPLFQAQIYLDNTERILFPGKLATVTIETTSIDQALLVPSRSVFFIEDKPYVYVVQENKAKRRELHLGERNKSHYLVLSGLKENDKVIVSGRERVTDGREVYVQK
jgi:HlyD family secretion protein